MSETTTSPFRCIEGTLDEFLDGHTGKANADGPHLPVPLYMPLAPSVTLEKALSYVGIHHRQKAKEGKITMIAVAHDTKEVNC